MDAEDRIVDQQSRIADLFKHRIARLSGAVALALGLGLLPTAGLAATATFNFNGLNAGATNATISSTMTATLQAVVPGASVAVTGATAATTYNGDGHVVGPGNGATSYTLGTDAFLTNDSARSSTTIQMVFSGVSITGISFNYEIFPNATCTSVTNCSGGLPDFTFKAGATTAALTTYLHKVAGAPSATDATKTGTTYTHSPISGSGNTERAPQYIGSFSAALPAGTSVLQFIDWPVLIGIDDLVITTGGPSGIVVPEPGTLALFGAGLLGLAGLRRRRAGD